MYDIIGEKVVISPSELAYEPFRTMYNEAEDKELIQKYIEYIVWMNKPTSRYVKAYPPRERDQQVRRDVFGDKDYKLPNELPQWVSKYNELSQTPASRLLRATRNKVEDMIKFFNESGDIVDDASAQKIVAMLSRIGSIAESLRRLEAEVLVEENSTKSVRGGYEIGLYELPDKK
jgi:predicted XRE-type DNA-binding protein